MSTTRFRRIGAGNQVVEILADYQKRTNGGDGFLRLIRFVPAQPPD